MSAPDGSLTGREWGILLVLRGAIFLEGIDVAMRNRTMHAPAGSHLLSPPRNQPAIKVINTKTA